MMNSRKELDAQAREILRLNDRGSYTIPTKGLYPYQWNWDSAFAALGFADFDIDRAWTELDTLFSGQWDSGKVPHILFHAQDPGYFPGPDVWGCNGPVPSSGITQPPVAATMARLILEKNTDVGLQRIEPLYEKMLAWHQWFIKHRLDNGAVCIVHPWEAGRDNAPDWDGAMSSINPEGVGEYVRRDTSHVDSSMRPTKYDYDRYIWLVQLGRENDWNDAAIKAKSPFRVAEPGMTFILLRAHRDLAKIGKALGKDISQFEQEIALLEKGAASLWNDKLGSFDSRDTVSGKWSNVLSNASFLCWYAGLDSEAMQLELKRVMDSVSYGVPSLDPANEKFDGKRYWRGPVWNTAKLIENHGFAEYFDPHDGTPAGGKSFTWTAAVWLSWASINTGAS